MSDLPLIARGRAADVFDAGGGRVLRRYRITQTGSVEMEADAMRYLRAQGAPVPEVFSADGIDIVMERLDGPTMLDVVKSKPWRAATIGRELKALHTRLHRIPAGGIELRRFSDGDAILHLDLHPDNVILTATGPMIIDWSNVAVGDPLADVMTTWMVMATSSPDGVPLCSSRCCAGSVAPSPTATSRAHPSTTMLAGGSPVSASCDSWTRTRSTSRRIEYARFATAHGIAA